MRHRHYRSLGVPLNTCLEPPPSLPSTPTTPAPPPHQNERDYFHCGDRAPMCLCLMGQTSLQRQTLSFHLSRLFLILSARFVDFVFSVFFLASGGSPFHPSAISIRLSISRCLRRSVRVRVRARGDARGVFDDPPSSPFPPPCPHTLHKQTAKTTTARC